MDDFKDILLDAETVLWSGKPKRTPRTPIYFAAIWFVLLCVLATPLGYAAIFQDMTIFENVSYTINGRRVDAGTPVSVVNSGLSLIAAMAIAFAVMTIVWIAAIKKQSYALTDRRAIFKNGLFGSKITSIPLIGIFAVERTGGDKTGTIKLYPTNPNLISRIAALYQIPANSFVQINSPFDVEKLVLETIAHSGEGTPS